MNSRIDYDWASSRKILLLLLLLTACLYLPAISFYFFADDDIYLSFSNRILREGNWADLPTLLIQPANPWEFLPVRDFSYWWDFKFYGDDPAGFHASNLAWYVCSCASAWWMFRESILSFRPHWQPNNATVLALFGTAIFAAHPAHVEVVVWVASRKDLLAATFGFMSLAAAIRTVRVKYCAAWLAFSLLMYVLACFSKAVAIAYVLPLFLVVTSCVIRVPIYSAWRHLLFLVLVAVITLVSVFVHWQTGQETGIRLDNAPGLGVVLERASRVLSSLLEIIWIPYPLRLYRDVYELEGWHWLVSGGALIFVLVAIGSFFRRPSLWALGIILMITSLVLYLQVAPFTTWSLSCERFVFASIAGLSMILLDVLGRLDHPRPITICAVVVVLLSSALIWGRLDDWRDTRRLIDLEYQRSPLFHNAIRDRIAYVLLPAKKYQEAEQLALTLDRPYAARALIAYINAERIYSRLIELEKEGAVEKKEIFRERFCWSVLSLRIATLAAYEQIKVESDVSYNNIMRTLDRRLNVRFGDALYICNKK